MKKAVAAGELDGPYRAVFGDVSKIIHETLCDLHSGSPPLRTVCTEANRFAAAVLLQPETFSVFTGASGFDVIALQKQYRCSYASATLRLAEVMRRQPCWRSCTSGRRRANPTCGRPIPRPERSGPR